MEAILVVGLFAIALVLFRRFRGIEARKVPLHESVLGQVLVGFLLYFVLFVPVYLIVAFLEGAFWNGWGLTVKDLRFQLSAFLGLLGILTFVTGMFAVPINQLCKYFLSTGKSKRTRLIIAGLLTPFTIFFSATAIMAVLAGHFFGGLFYAAFPAAFLISSATLGLTIELLVLKSEQP
jgi:hypothetical protein